MSYALSGTTPAPYLAPVTGLQTILAPERPASLTDTPAGSVLATVLALVPAAAFGAWTGASMASYDDKQKEWALIGAATGGALAAVMLALNALRKTETS